MGELEEKFVEPKHEGSPASNPTQCLAHLFASKEMVDLTIIIPGHNDNFKVHRLVLGMWSQVFHAMLFGPMAEGDMITLEDDPPEAFNWLLNYMYAGQIEFPSIELALQVYHLANKYLMIHLKSVCSEYLKDKVTAVSVPEILNIATLLEDEALIKKCAEVLDKSADSFFSSPTIGSLNRDSLEQLLRQDLPVSSEAVIYQGIINWGEAQIISKDKENKAITLRQEVEKFLPQIRFLSMSCEEFVKHVLTEPILTLKEIQAISLNIAGILEVEMPPLFSTEKDERAKFHSTKLKTCYIRKGKLISSEREAQHYKPTILNDIHTKDIIYLSKIVYDTSIGYTGSLSVNDSSGKALLAVRFDGKIANFSGPLKLLREERYTFILHPNSCSSMYRCSNSYNIKHNELISGQLMNDFTIPCVFHYWK